MATKAMLMVLDSELGYWIGNSTFTKSSEWAKRFWTVEEAQVHADRLNKEWECVSCIVVQDN